MNSQSIAIRAHSVSAATGLVLSLAYMSVAFGKSQMQPRCEVVSTRLGVFYELDSHGEGYGHSARDAEKIVLRAMHPKDRKELEKTIPGLYDWLVSTSVKGWQLGYKDPGLYMKKFEDTGYSPNLVHPMSFSHWMQTQCENKYPPN